MHVGVTLGSVGWLGRPHGGNGGMRSGDFERLVKFGVWTLTALVLQGFSAPSVARASCSQRPGAPSTFISTLYHFDQLILGGTSTASDDSPATSPGNSSSRRPRGTCSGLNCSSRVPLPVSATFQGSERSDQWGTLGMLAVPELPSLPTRATNEPTTHAVGHISCIFHPPRV
jgi:hypothetical protein